MFDMTMTTPCKIQGTIRVSSSIKRLGSVTDVDGVRWDVRGIFGIGGKQVVQAIKACQLHPSYTDTSGQFYGFVQQSWKPYDVEVVTDG
jgi:hypothetical protein